MVVAYKNFWSMNIDEAVVAGLLRSRSKDIAEVFMPLNAQLKDIDLVLVNPKNRKSVTIQVKGSKAYEPTAKDRREFKKGSSGWFFIKPDKIKKCRADFFILLVYVLVESKKKGRRYLEPHTITISPKKLFELCRKQKVLHKSYSFYIWVNPDEKKAFDYRDQ